MKPAPLHVRIRPLAEGEIRELEWRLPDPDLQAHRKRFAAQAADALIFLVAWYDRTAIGHLAVTWSDGGAELVDLLVLPAFRRRGVGAQLVAQAEALALLRKQPCVVARVPAANRPARRLFAGRGYSPEGKVRRGEAVRMVRQLARVHPGAPSGPLST